MKTFPPAIALALLCSVTTAFAQQAVTLRQGWEIGKKYTQSSSMTQSTSLNIGGMNMDQKLQMSSETSLSVAAGTPPRKRMTIIYNYLTMDTDMGGQKSVVDSRKPGVATGPLGDPFAGLAGKEIHAITDANDKVIEFENLAEIQKTGAGSNPVRASLLSEEALSQMISEKGLVTLPGKPVNPGDNWPFQFELPIPQIGTVTITGTYTFKGMTPIEGNPCAEILVDGVVGVDITSKKGAASGTAAQLGMKLEKGTVKGSIWMDNAAGVARARELTQEMVMSVKNPLAPGESIQVPMKQLIKTTMVSIEPIK